MTPQFTNAEIGQLHHEMVLSFEAQEKKQDELIAEMKKMNGRVRDVELWQARIEGARLLGVGVWQMLATTAAVIAASVAVVLAAGS